MELTSAQRKIAFAVIVVVFAVLGYALLRSAAHAPSHTASSPPGPAASQPGATQPSASASPAASASARPPSASVPAAPDIYQWLPFTESGLGAAVRTVVRFGDDYGTYSYSENAKAYLAPMRSLITDQLGQLLAQAYSTPGVASMRTSRRQVSTGTAEITSMRAFGPSSITFVVAVTQQITDKKGTSQSTADYAVTVTGGGTSWQVSDIELASAGNS